MDHNSIQSSIEEFIKGKFPGGEILSVALIDEHESEGDRVFVFRVEFDGTVAEFVENTPLNLSRTVMDRLREMEVEGFPFLDFVPTNELRA